MRPSIAAAERTCIYLGITAAIALALGWRGPGEPAVAQNAAGIVPAQAFRLATADAVGLVERLITSPRYDQARAAYADEQNKRLEPLLAQLQTMRGEASKLPPESPDLARIQQDFQGLQQQAQSVQVDIDTYNTRQVAEAYRLVIEALDRAATDRGYTHAIATRTGEVSIKSDNIPGAVQEMLARPLAKTSAADDLTNALAKEFGLEAVPPVGVESGTQAPSAPPSPVPTPVIPK